MGAKKKKKKKRAPVSSDDSSSSGADNILYQPKGRSDKSHDVCSLNWLYYS